MHLYQLSQLGISQPRLRENEQLNKQPSVRIVKQTATTVQSHNKQAHKSKQSDGVTVFFIVRVVYKYIFEQFLFRY